MEFKNLISAIIYILALFWKILIHCMEPQCIRVSSIIFQNHNYFLKLLKCTYCQFLWTILSFNSMKMYYIWLKILFGESNSKNLMKCSLVNRSKIVTQERGWRSTLYSFWMYFNFLFILQKHSLMFLWNIHSTFCSSIAVVIFEYFRPKFGKICKKVFLKIKATQQHPHLFLK